ncbi:hypothetical protein W03_19960 [Nitrosomonas sp. PY1]|uniref:hypothetical protein n=1 Tax=Nitrosomonas sp. PY1 TaxID=1803906 RepID=UPI001FC7CD78|nr:hypothetical protein [Nitrosomonas sp. PY1]GKS69992.1 hypothetical protein W03_19960 [Nitrosomonas sp. PY1]
MGVTRLRHPPVDRKPTHLDWNTPATYFSGAQITNRDISWANFNIYFFQLNEGHKMKQRNLSTTGFPVVCQTRYG